MIAEGDVLKMYMKREKNRREEDTGSANKTELKPVPRAFQARRMREETEVVKERTGVYVRERPRGEQE